MTKLNIGCGPIHLDGWVNIDKGVEHQPDVVYDVTKPHVLFGENSVDLILTIHMLEHLPWPNGVTAFLTSMFSILKPGGTLRVVVPDLMKVAKLYVAGDDLKGIYGPDFAIVGPDCAATRFMAFARGWQHSILFDERLLRKLMFQAGFVNIRVMPFGESYVPELRGLDRMPAESLSMECQKCQ